MVVEAVVLLVLDKMAAGLLIWAMAVMGFPSLARSVAAVVVVAHGLMEVKEQAALAAVETAVKLLLLPELQEQRIVVAVVAAPVVVVLVETAAAGS
jgi:hypothetical protein